MNIKANFQKMMINTIGVDFLTKSYNIVVFVSKGLLALSIVSFFLLLFTFYMTDFFVPIFSYIAASLIIFLWLVAPAIIVIGFFLDIIVKILNEFR